MNPTERALTSLTPEEEAIMQETIEAELAPFTTITPPDLLATMREQAEQAFRTHPAARQLLAAAARRKVLDASTSVRRDGEPEQARELKGDNR